MSLMPMHRMNANTRCWFCGVRVSAGTNLCTRCGEKYVEEHCTTCGALMIRSRDFPARKQCARCAGDASMAAVDATTWRYLDPLIFDCRIIDVIDQLIKRFGLEFEDAQDLMQARYRHLRETEPARFALDHKAYWSGYIS